MEPTEQAEHIMRSGPGAVKSELVRLLERVRFLEARVRTVQDRWMEAQDELDTLKAVQPRSA